LNEISELKPYASNATSGRRQRVAGHGDCNGTIRFAAAASGASPLVAGTSYTLELYESATQIHTVTAMISQIQKQTNVDTGDIVSYTANFEGNGAYTAPSS